MRKVSSLLRFFIFYIRGLYKTRSCCLRYLMDCGIFKTPRSICSAFNHFQSQSLNSAVYSTLAVTMRRQCLLPHVELISIDAINSVWIKSLLFSPALGWSGLRGWMSPKAINTDNRGFLCTSLRKLFENLPHPHTASPNVHGKHGDGAEPQLQHGVHHLLLHILKAMVTPELPWRWPSWAPHQKAHRGGGAGCSGSHGIGGAVLSPSALCWIITLQPCKITRTSAHGKEKKEKKNMNRNTKSNI